MDLFSGLTAFLQGLLASSLVIVHLMFANASALFTSLTSPAPSNTAPAVTTTAPVPQAATSTTPAPAEATTTAPKHTAPAPTKTTTPAAASTPATKPPPAAPATPLLSPEQVNVNTRASLVNILCSFSNGGVSRFVSGSGVIVDSRGIILTNAHVAQFFLLRDYPSRGATDCTIRTGSPASPMYRASLLYLPPAWINENASQINAEQAVGTGENDYALLYIDSTTNPAGTLPSFFSNLPMTTFVETNVQVLVAGYPAGFLDAQTIQSNLYPTTAFSKIGQIYTFNDPSHVDVVSVGGTVVSQGGSSGGAVVRTYDGKLSGLISTETVGTTTADRDLRAITVSYIDRSLKEAGKGGIIELLTQDPHAIEADFASTFTQEEQQLANALSKKQ